MEWSLEMSDDLRTIEIDFDLHKRIETARESFSESAE